jgi:beta-aspartyl-peptidase (threonine type)
MYALALHGGAGPRPHDVDREREQSYARGLAAALQSGQQLLERGGAALDAVELAVTALEDDPLFNAAVGCVLTAAGTPELDAAIMDGASLRAGAVAQVSRVRNPIQLARQVMERTVHVLLVDGGAEAFAAEIGLPLVTPEYFITPARRRELAERRTASYGTVGAVARDRHGNLAAATSTGGMTGKRPGRVGDSPLIGAGTYADNETCAVSMTGHGEWIIRTVQAYDIAARLRYGGMSLKEAVSAAIDVRLPALGAAGGLIAVDQRGNLCLRYNTPVMFRASVRTGQPAEIHVY